MAGKNNENIRETGRQLAGSIGGSEPASTRNAHPDSSLPHRAHAQEKDQVVRSELGRHISIAVDPVALVTTECITVTSAMRKHARWAHSSVSMILGGGPSMARDISQLPRQTGQRQQRRLTNGSVDEDDTLANRWGLRGKKGKSMQDQPLLSAFTRLRNDLRGCTDIQDFDVPALLHPFLQVIRSSSTSAPITSLAIVAITKFFAYNLIGRDSPRLSLAMQLLSAAITHCRFEASDSAADEIVLLGILELMENMLSGPGGDLLGDESVCEMMETGLSMCCQTRLSELLRRKAEMSMIKMCQTIFERLKSLEIEAGEDIGILEAEATGLGGHNVIMNDIAVNGSSVGLSEPVVNGSASANAVAPATESVDDVKGIEESSSDGADAFSIQQAAAEPDPKPATIIENVEPIPPGAEKIESASQLQRQDSSEQVNIKPYSLPSIRELFRVLVDLLQPHNRQHGDALRVMALRIIDVALEVAGPSIAKHPSLATLAKDDLCRYLFQLVRSDNMNLLNESLRVAGTLLATCREVLKLQQELFLSYVVSCLHPRVEIEDELGIDPALYAGVPKTPKLVKPSPSPQTTSGRSTPVPLKERKRLGMEGGARKPDAMEAMVESIGALSRMPSYLVELYVNYDCEVDRYDLCEDLVGLLSRNAFPDSVRWSTTNVPPLCLDSLLGYVQFVADRLEDEPIYEGYPNMKSLRAQRERKKIIVKGATKFNENPRAGIAYLAHHDIIENPDDPKSVARFLRGTTRISKSVLGEFLSKKANEELLRSFLDLFDFSGKRVDEALRDLLNSFRLPGESQLIERIVTVFCQRYCSSTELEDIANEDAVFTLTYAIIMLNTDQHNPNLKKDKRMTYLDFAKNLRGVNGGSDFAPAYLQGIYDSIKSNEIILPDEHNNKQAFDYAWEELLIKARTSAPLTMCDTNIFDADMFHATWRPIIATLSYVFMSATDDAVFSRVVLGFDQCAQIAAKYNISEALDHIIFCLSSMSTLGTTSPTNTALNTVVQAEKRSVMVSELAVHFGRDYKAQLACAVLFRLIPRKEHCIQKGWNQIVRIWLNLFANSLLKPSLSKSEELLGIPSIPLQPPSQVIDREQRTNEGGLLSTFGSFLSSYAADDPPEPSEEELESTLCTVDCIDSCPMRRIFSKVLNLPPEGRECLVRALLKQLPEQSSPAVIVVRPDRPKPAPIRTNGHRSSQSGPTYDPSMVFVLEMITILSTRDQASVKMMGQAVVDALDTVVRDTANIHPLMLSRAVFYMLYLLNAAQDYDFVRATVILHTIAGYDEATLAQSATPILKGLSLCILEPSDLKKQITNMPDFWTILNRLRQIPEAASKTFDLLAMVVGSNPPAVTADNYEAVVTLLHEFAMAGSIGAAIEQKRDRLARRREKPGEEKPKIIRPRENEVVDRGFKAVIMIYQLTNRVPALIEQSHLEKQEAWRAYWSPIFEALRSQCLNPCREIRHQAVSCLQSSLLSPSLASGHYKEWTAIFSEVLFPLISRLLRPEIYQTDPVGMSDTRLQAANLLCKVFLHYLTLLSEWEGMLDLWLRILDVLDRLMNSGQGDNLEEAVPESLKNILLVMAGDGYIEPPVDGRQRTQMWDETVKRVDRFLPELIGEIFPKIKEPPAPPPGEQPMGESENIKGGDGAVDEQREDQTVAEKGGEVPNDEGGVD